MEVTVRLFAMLRERAGAGEVSLDLPEGARVEDALRELGGLAEGLPLVMAVNREYAPFDRVLDPGDELALIPPVSGGVGEPAPAGARASAPARHRPADRRAAPWVRVTEEALSQDALAERVRDPRAGAVVTFQGVTRRVEKLHYEAYVEMAEERLAEIAQAALDRHALCAAAVEHRVGEVPLTEPSVIVAVSAPHRGEAFAGAREIIDRAKAEAPIWKKEVEGGEERWVEGSRPG
jgi:MoaE-MoaD fusion protein